MFIAWPRVGRQHRHVVGSRVHGGGEALPADHVSDIFLYPAFAWRFTTVLAVNVSDHVGSVMPRSTRCRCQALSRTPPCYRIRSARRGRIVGHRRRWCASDRGACSRCTRSSPTCRDRHDYRRDADYHPADDSEAEYRDHEPDAPLGTRVGIEPALPGLMAVHRVSRRLTSQRS